MSRLGKETETDTDGEARKSGWPRSSGKYVRFPFPHVPAANAEKESPLDPSKQKTIQYNIDWSVSSARAIPRKNVDRGNGMETVFLRVCKSLTVIMNGMGFTFLFVSSPANSCSRNGTPRISPSP